MNKIRVVVTRTDNSHMKMSDEYALYTYKAGRFHWVTIMGCIKHWFPNYDKIKDKKDYTIEIYD